MLCLPNCFYRPQRSWAKVMFLQASVILSTGGCLPQCMLGYTPPWSRHPSSRSRHPPGADPPGADTHPPGADTPQSRHPLRSSPLEQTPPPSRPPWEQTPPGADTPSGADPPREADTPPPEADSGIRSTSGRYASYWNAFLLIISNITFNLSDGDNRMRWCHTPTANQCQISSTDKKT